jgi:hypothetical protein
MEAISKKIAGASQYDSLKMPSYLREYKYSFTYNVRKNITMYYFSDGSRLYDNGDVCWYPESDYKER